MKKLPDFIIIEFPKRENTYQLQKEWKAIGASGENAREVDTEEDGPWWAFVETTHDDHVQQVYWSCWKDEVTERTQGILNKQHASFKEWTFEEALTKVQAYQKLKKQKSVPAL